MMIRRIPWPTLRQGATVSRGGSAFAAVLIGAAVGLGLPPLDLAANAATERSGDELLVVDCLLPGQVRQLGRMTTYVAARRPVKTTARDCEIRGGEYTSYDRASYAAALQVWLPQAEAGDAAAQNNVGEIFEKGLGLEPDYQAAAKWYRKAADQGYSRAQINLGNLYERGLGVERDPKQALNLYRRASGLEDSVILDAGTLNANAREMEALRDEVARRRDEAQFLRQQLEDTRRQLERARRELERRQSEVQSERTKLEQAKAALELRVRSAEANQDTEAVQSLSGELAQRSEQLAQKDSQLADLRAEIARVEAEAKRHREQLARLESESQENMQAMQAEVQASRDEAARLRSQLAEARGQLDRVRGELDAVTGRVAASQEALVAARERLEREKKEEARDEGKLRKLEAALEAREEALASQREEMARIKQEFERVRTESSRYKEMLASLEEQEQAKAKRPPAAAASPPTIEMIDPTLLATRAAPTVTLRSAVPERVLVGRVSAPAGLLTLTVNDQPTQPNETGVFRTSVPVRSARTPVTIVAVDQQGNRGTLSFDMLREQAEATLAKQAQPEPPRPDLDGVRFGQFHALVIGNNDYPNLPPLTTPVSDAKEVEAILRTKYGFKTKLLLNANRYQILSELNRLRAELTEEDNLLIYYAGHGELDRVNLRGHWLPVDAEADNSANWISNVAITDILNVMTAKQILVVADSCYSGALTRSALGRLQPGMSHTAKTSWLKVMAGKRSRTVLTSGGEKPVLDSTGGKHSIFAAAFLEVLRSNRDVLEGGRLFGEVASRVTAAAEAVPFKQVPEYAPLKYAGHEGGDFFFVPKG